MRRYPKYKETGIDGVGKVPEHWKIIKLKYIAKIFNGQDQKDVLEENGEYPIYGSGGIFGYANQYLFEGPSVLLGRKGTVDKPRLVQTPFWSVDTAYYTKISKKVNTFIFFHLCTQINFDYYIYGSAIPSMTARDLNEIKFPLSPLPEQHAIVRFLDYKTGQIDSFIANRQKQIELLKEQKAGIINKAVTKGINPNAKMKNSGIEWIGEVPEHWEVWKLKFLTKKIGSGVTPLGGSEVYKTEGIAFFRSQNIYNDRFELSNISFIEEAIHKGMKGSVVLSGDVLLNITGASIGRCYYFSNEFSEANVNQHVCIIRANKNVLFRFLHCVMISEIGQNQILSTQSGSNREGLNFEQLKQFVIPLPNKVEQQAILNFIKEETSNVDTLTSKYQKQIDLMQEYRTSLISQAVTGKIDVREWEPKREAV